MEIKFYHGAILVSFTATPPVINTANYVGGGLSSPSSNVRNIFETNLRSSFGVLFKIVHDIGMKWWALKAKNIVSFGHLQNDLNILSNINGSVKSTLQNLIISHPYVIQSFVENYYIKLNLNDGNLGSKTELSQIVLLQVSVREIHIDMLKKGATRFTMAYDEKILV